MRKHAAILLALAWLFLFAGLIPGNAFALGYVMNGAAPYAWIDIAATGQEVSFSHADDGLSTLLPLGFNFSYYGNTYSGVYVSTNGLVGFSLGGAGTPANTLLPSLTDPDNIIAPFWTDLVLYDLDVAKVYAQTIGVAPYRKFVVTYSNVDLFGVVNSDLTFQVILEENGNNITFQYQDMLRDFDGNVSFVTIGVENAAGNAGIQYTAGSIANGQAIRFALDRDDDGVADISDNCPVIANADQADTDGDGLGDACDDSDTDVDGLTDREEWVYGTNPGVADQDLDQQLDGADSNPFDGTVTGATPTPLNDDREFVRQVYRDFLNREADDAGLAFWAGHLAAGNLTRAALVEQSLQSAEFQGAIAPVVRLYFTFYQRLPDYNGLMFWVNAYASGMSLAAIADEFARAQEFIDRYGTLTDREFVQQMYLNVYRRAADQGGEDFWTAHLEAGNLTRGQVMVEFASAPEYLQLSANQVYVMMTYVGMLRREPDQRGFDFWVSVMDQGVSGQELITLFLTSAEYAGRFDGSSWTVPTMAYAYPYHYDTVVEDEDENGDGIIDTRYTTVYSYDPDDVLLQTAESYDTGADGSIESTVLMTYGYDGNGNLQSAARSNDWNNDGVADSIWTTSYATDPLGRVIQRVEARDYDADGTPEVTLPTLSTWNGAGLLNSQVTAYDFNLDGIIDAVETFGYGYDANGQLTTIDREYDAQNDGNPESVKAAVYTWNGDRLAAIVTTVDSDGDTAIDWVETQTFAYDANGNLTTLADTLDVSGDGSTEYQTIFTVDYDVNGLLLDFWEEQGPAGGGTTDYRRQVTPVFTALGMPTGLLPQSANKPLVLPAAVGVLQ